MPNVVLQNHCLEKSLDLWGAWIPIHPSSWNCIVTIYKLFLNTYKADDLFCSEHVAGDSCAGDSGAGLMVGKKTLSKKNVKSESKLSKCCLHFINIYIIWISISWTLFHEWNVYNNTQEPERVLELEQFKSGNIQLQSNQMHNYNQIYNHNQRWTVRLLGSTRLEAVGNVQQCKNSTIVSIKRFNREISLHSC